MSIREIIELQVRGIDDLTSAATQAERLAKALGKVSAANRTEQILARRAADAERFAARLQLQDRRHQQRMIEMRTRGEQRISQIQKSQSGGLAEGAVKAAAVVAAVAASAAVAVSAGKAVIEAQAFREDVTRGLQILLKSKSEADRVLKMASETADFIGRDRTSVAGQFVDLLAKGFNSSRVDEITRRLADLSTVDPRANLEGLSRAIGQIAGKGRLQGDELLQLAEAGLETGDVYKAIAKSLGKSIPEIQKLQTAGKISSEVAVDAILEAIKGQTGGKGAGAAAREKSLQDLSGLIQRVSDIPKNLLFDMQPGPGLDKIKAFLRDIIEFFDAGSASGKEARAAIADTFNAIAEGLLGRDLSKSNTKEVLQDVIKAIRDSKEDIKAFAGGIRTIAGVIVTLTGIFARFHSETASGSSLGAAGILKYIPATMILARVFDKIASMTEEGSPLDRIQTFLSSAVQTVTTFVPSMIQAGMDLISGLVQGISSGASAVASAASSIASKAVDAVTGLWQSHSPSEVFKAIAREGAAGGLVVGFDQGGSRVERAAADMAMRAVGGASGPMGPANTNAAPAAAPAGASTIGPIHIHVHGAGSAAEAREQGAAAAEAFLDHLRKALPVVQREQTA